MLQDGSKSLKLSGSGEGKIGKDVVEHAVRQACDSLLKQALEKGINPMLYRHGDAAEPSLKRLLDFTVSAAALSQASFDPCEHSDSKTMCHILSFQGCHDLDLTSPR